MAMLPTASNSPWVPSSSSSSSSSPSLSFLPWRRRARRSGTACKRRGDTGGGPAASSLSPRCFLRSGCLCSSWQRDPR
ncbi:hypothetical protein SORBI_3006G098800 [Sorghum bicolor]|nr:hypothetical protein SORBI_3006G098800 [Sorghum bicolor]